MTNTPPDDATPRHLRIVEPAPWVVRFAALIREGGSVLDLACGGGRHARHLLGLGLDVTMVDRDTGAVADLKDRAEIIQTDLEAGPPEFLKGRGFDAVVVVNYLHRPLIPPLLEAISEDGGVLIYQTFAVGNEKFAKPRNPDHLLKSGELLGAVEGAMQVVAYEHGLVESGPLPGVIQRICAIKTDEPVAVEPT